MNWYCGSIPDAITEAKHNGKLFLVYIEGEDDLSKQMSATYNDPVVSAKLASQNCVALKLSANSVSCQQFCEIYPVLVIPSSFFIGRNGIPIEILTGSLEPPDFCEKIDTVFELHAEEKKNVIRSQSSISPNASVVTTETPSSPSERSSLGAAAAVAEANHDNMEHSQQESKSSSANSNAEPESTLVTSSGCAVAAAVESSSSLSPVKDAEQTPSTSQSAQEGSTPSSPEDVAPLKDRVERAKALLEERRILKELEESEKEKKEEIERRKVGKALQQAQQTRQETELKEWALNRAKEKEEERLAKERVRAQIAQDRAERAAKFQQDKARELEILKEKENAALRSEQERAARNAALRSTTAHLQFRLPNGSSITHQFPADSTLEDARQFVLQEVRPSFGYFTLCTTFPRRHFAENNYAETLRDLQLAPSATLLILPVAAIVPRGGGFLNILVWTLLAPFLFIWRMFSTWFRGSTTVGHAAPPPHEGQSQAGNGESQPPSTSNRNPDQSRAPGADKQPPQRRDGFYRQDGNIFRINSHQNDDDENNTWNGNSTQQM